MIRDNLTHLTDVLGDGTKVWHLWCAGVVQDRSETRCPQIELLGPSIQLQAVNPAEPLMLTSVLFPICTFLGEKSARKMADYVIYRKCCSVRMYFIV